MLTVQGPRLNNTIVLCVRYPLFNLHCIQVLLVTHNYNGATKHCGGSSCRRCISGKNNYFHSWIMCVAVISAKLRGHSYLIVTFINGYLF